MYPPFSPQESGSDFASVVHVPKRLTPWRKLNDKDHLSLLHANFWGKSMAIEEQEWLSAQSRDLSTSGDDSMEEDVDDDLDEDVGDDLDEDLDDYLDEDLETDDIIPGCCLLDVGGDIPKIWVRADYMTSSRPITRNLQRRHSGRQLLSSRVNQALVSSGVSLCK